MYQISIALDSAMLECMLLKITVGDDDIYKWIELVIKPISNNFRNDYQHSPILYYIFMGKNFLTIDDYKINHQLTLNWRYYFRVPISHHLIFI